MEQRAEYTCKKCRGHGQIVPLKGHKKACPWQQCKCSRCLQVEVYRHQHAHDQDIQVRGATSSSQGLRAEEVIGVANLIKKGEEDSTSDRTKSAELNRKLEARGIRNKELYSALNRSMEQYSAERPNTHPALHLRKAITEYQEQRDRSSGEGKGRKYSYTTTTMWDSYSSSPAVPSLTANSSQAKKQVKEPQEPTPGCSRQSDIDEDIEKMREIVPEAEVTLGLSVLQDIRASCRDAEDAIEMLLALMRSSTKTPSPSHRVLPCRQAKLAELFPNVSPGLLKAISDRSEDTPAAVETVINVFASPKSIGQTPYATHRGKKRRRFLCFTPDKHGPRTRTPETPPQPTTPETPPQPTTPETPPQPTTSVKYVPGPRTPNLKPDNECAQMLNFNRDINSAKQAVEGAELASGGATYYIKGPRKTPVKKEDHSMYTVWALLRLPKQVLRGMRK
ncbi:PREDICTED: doublesex- and mab-3-related transcription factor A2-like [Branchiostoma belcheri]|uniref:Doublesex- and mab-3-related transcription factor A2-like n=1 Tax=Branchiostoma belcheri TaxID=7741 RepID=A0A6P4YWB3_BRABE|nr:PREDICTED: doublesex- and mab-3-related transcription factor A2-like [Branchiostoma belcheri]